MSARIQKRFLSPLPGLGGFCATDPRLAPWATVCRRSAASANLSLVAQMNWIVQNLWSIPALPFFGAGRDGVDAGVRRGAPSEGSPRREPWGAGVKDIASPGGA
jgi:hypothetical protein